MINNFEMIREELHEAIEKFGLNSEETMKISEKCNEQVNLYYKNERQYREYDFMYKKYVESVNHLKKITKDFSKFPTIKEWNYYAKENDLLCSECLKYISANNWHELRNKILTEM